MCLTSSSMNSGLPPDSAITCALRRNGVVATQKRETASSRASEWVKGSTASSRWSRLEVSSSSAFLSSRRNTLFSESSERKQPIKSRTGDCCVEIRSARRMALSRSPHCRSSIARMRRSLPEPDQELAQGVERAAAQFLLVGHHGGVAAAATAVTLSRTGKTWPRAPRRQEAGFQPRARGAPSSIAPGRRSSCRGPCTGRSRAVAAPGQHHRLVFIDEVIEK